METYKTRSLLRISLVLASILVPCTPAATQVKSRVIDIVPGTGDSDPSELTVLGDRLIFVATDASGDRELWISDGTITGTKLLKDTDPSGSGSPSFLIQALGKVFFVAKTVKYGRELWVTDGTTQGTFMLRDIRSGSGHGLFNVPYGAYRWAEYRGELYFFAARLGSSAFVWKTDGTTKGTVQLSAQNIDLGSPGWMCVLGDKLLYSGTLRSNPLASGELVISDGTTKGTHILKDINTTPSQGSGIYGLTVHRGKAYFIANDGKTGFEPWVTDGTTQGTKPLGDFLPGSGPGIFVNGGFVGSGDKVFFRCKTKKEGLELWATDGTPSGTHLVRDIVVGAADSAVLFMTPFGDGKIAFSAAGTSRQTTLWVSDGTKEGTHEARTTTPQPLSPRFLVRIGHGRVYFRAFTKTDGRELWSTDGTDLGTNQILDLHIAGSSNPEQCCQMGCEVFFRADLPRYGKELFAVPAGAISQVVGSGCDPFRGARPRMYTTDPVLGKQITLRGDNATPRSASLLAVGMPADLPYMGCRLYVQPLNAVFLGFLPQDLTWTLKLKVPKNLPCMKIAAQAAYYGPRLTNGVHLWPGK